MQPIFLALLLTSGIRFPIVAGVAGFSYLIGRIGYFNGYSSGDPSGRLKDKRFSLLQYGGLLTMVVSAVVMAVELVMGKSPLLSL